MPRSLADGHEKIIILLEEPVDPEAPTLAELNAGIEASANILATDWTFGATDSEKFSEPAVAEEQSANAFGRSNFQLAMTIFRQFDETTKNPDVTEDALFAALAVKGTEFWVYSRKTAKKSTEALAADDSIRLGAKAITDEPQDMSGGYIKNRVPCEVQEAWPNLEVAAA